MPPGTLARHIFYESYTMICHFLTSFFLSNLLLASLSRATLLICSAADFSRRCWPYCFGESNATLTFILVGDNMGDVRPAALPMTVMNRPTLPKSLLDPCKFHGVR